MDRVQKWILRIKPIAYDFYRNRKSTVSSEEDTKQNRRKEWKQSQGWQKDCRSPYSRCKKKWNVHKNDTTVNVCVFNVSVYNQENFIVTIKLIEDPDIVLRVVLVLPVTFLEALFIR